MRFLKNYWLIDWLECLQLNESHILQISVRSVASIQAYHFRCKYLIVIYICNLKFFLVLIIINILGWNNSHFWIAHLATLKDF